VGFLRFFWFVNKERRTRKPDAPKNAFAMGPPSHHIGKTIYPGSPPPKPDFSKAIGMHVFSNLRPIGVLALIAFAVNHGGRAARSGPDLPASPRTRSYANPLLARNVPDPDVIYARPYYYLFATNTLAREGWGWIDHKDHWMPIFRSRDLVQWEYRGDVFQRKPIWIGGEGLWAPDLHYWKGKYWLYYSTSGRKIGLATAASPEGPWNDLERPFWEGDIDPHVFIEKGRRYFLWGSRQTNGRPIRIQELSADGLRLVGQRAEIGEGEGAFLIRRRGYYYLFQSFSGCCRDDSDYHVTVSRSASLFGPYRGRDNQPTRIGETILQKNAEWAGPGHLTIISDARHQDWVLYHAIKDGRYGRNGRWLLLDRLAWDQGWPTVGKGTPSTEPQSSPQTG
jgi:arabinan endo-1,5-alpha-L-arabinosidase